MLHLPPRTYLVAVLQFSRDVVTVTSKYKLVMTINEEALDNNNKRRSVRAARASNVFNIIIYYIGHDTLHKP